MTLGLTQPLGHKDGGPFIMGAMVADHRLKGAQRVALQKKASKLTGADPAVAAHLAEDPEAGGG